MLVEIDAEQADAIAYRDAAPWPIAPGWPHEDAIAGLGFARSGGWQFVILDVSGRLAGECGTKTAPRDGVVEIGYGLAAPSRGQGLGSAAVSELVELLRCRPEVRAIEAEIQVSNTPSRRVVERLGFDTDGLVVQGYLRYRLTVSH